MWYCPEKYEKKTENINDILLGLKGELKDKEAKATLAQFLAGKIGFTTELISGVKLATYQ